MVCFLDRPDLDENYKRRLIGVMPAIKKSRYCSACISSSSTNEVEPINCDYYIEVFVKTSAGGVIPE